MQTRKQIRSDIETQLAQVQQNTWPERQIYAWMDQVRATLLREQYQKNNRIDAGAITEITNLKPQTVNGNLVLLLPYLPLDLPQDGGVLSVEGGATQYDKIPASSVRLFKDLPLARPSQRRPAYYYKNGQIVLLGVNSMATECIYSVRLVPASTDEERGCGCGANDYYPISANLVLPLVQGCVEIGRAQYGQPKDVTSDATINPVPNT